MWPRVASKYIPFVVLTNIRLGSYLQGGGIGILILYMYVEVRWYPVEGLLPTTTSFTSVLTHTGFATFTELICLL